jgi:hypothetical protein
LIKPEANSEATAPVKSKNTPAYGATWIRIGRSKRLAMQTFRPAARVALPNPRAGRYVAADPRSGPRTLLRLCPKYPAPLVSSLPMSNACSQQARLRGRTRLPLCE